MVAACATAGSGGALEPRYVAVHNALAAMGLAQVGPIHEGSLLQGHEARVSVDLAAGCTTVVTIGGDGVGDVDATLLDPKGRPIAHDTTSEPQAVLRACIDAPDTYTLVVTAAAGSGTWVAATWAGGIGGPQPAALNASPLVSSAPLGTCASPFPLAAGTFNGTTARGESTTTGSCATSKTDAPEAVYELDVSQRERVTVDVQARFDAVLYIRKGDCADENAEVDCNDDVPGDENHSRVEDVLDPGKYFVFVDGYNRDSGGFKITVTVSEAVALTDGCRRARPLVPGAVASSSNANSTDMVGATCGNGAPGPDVPWRMTLALPSRVRIVEHSDAFAPMLHVRQACTWEESEVACAEATAPTDAVLTRVLPAGSYTVFADAHEADARGDFTIGLDTGPVDGEGVTGDACVDAVEIPLHHGTGAGVASATVTGDTFLARDDVAASCGGKGAPDVVYRMHIDRRSRLTAQLSAEQAPHLLLAWRGCGGGSSGAIEVACGRTVDVVVDAGTYFLAVDGFRADDFGRFEVDIASEDVSGQAAACASAPPLAPGRNAGTLAGGSDDFGASCLPGPFGAGGPDRVYKLVVPWRTAVELTLTSTGFEGAVALRRACADGPGGAAAAEVECEGTNHSIEQTLDAGTYWVVVNSTTPGRGGAYTLRYDRAPAVERGVMH